MDRSLGATVTRLRQLVAELEPARLDGDRARELVEQFAEAERLCAAGKTLALRQVAATRSWRKTGPYRDVNAWFASISGSTLNQASLTVDTARRLESLPDTESALRAGELSGVQVVAVADAAAADPYAERALLESAARDGVRGLRNAAARVKAAACRDEAAREEQIRRARSLRHWIDADGAGRVDVRGPVTDVARVLAALERFERSLFDAARQTGSYERPDAYAFDAFVALAQAPPVRQSSTSACTAAPTYVGVIRIDHKALVRGHTEPGEICELAGVGPIPVHEASRMLDDAFLKAVVVRGTDIATVSHLGRTIPAHLRTAVDEKFQECCIEGCHETRHLEIDHNIPIEQGGRTELDNLSRPCAFHHRYKHQHNLRLAGEGTHKRFVTIDGLPPPG